MITVYYSGMMKYDRIKIDWHLAGQLMISITEWNIRN
jgi:hypothetical protein